MALTNEDLIKLRDFLKDEFVPKEYFDKAMEEARTERAEIKDILVRHENILKNEVSTMAKQIDENSERLSRIEIELKIGT